MVTRRMSFPGPASASPGFFVVADKLQTRRCRRSRERERRGGGGVNLNGPAFPRIRDAREKNRSAAWQSSTGWGKGRKSGRGEGGRKIFRRKVMYRLLDLVKPLGWWPPLGKFGREAFKIDFHSSISDSFEGPFRPPRGPSRRHHFLSLNEFQITLFLITQFPRFSCGKKPRAPRRSGRHFLFSPPHAPSHPHPPPAYE